MANKYTVIRDTREQEGWWFPENGECEGTVEKKLDTGDYSIIGLENKFVIERKRNTSEFSQNINEDRFYRELDRLESFEFPYLLLEFTLDDIFRFPVNSGIPKFKWSKLRLTPQYILKRLLEIEIQYKTRIIFAGDRGMEMAELLFKYVSRHYGKEKSVGK